MKIIKIIFFILSLMFVPLAALPAYPTAFVSLDFTMDFNHARDNSCTFNFFDIQAPKGKPLVDSISATFVDPAISNDGKFNISMPIGSSVSFNVEYYDHSDNWYKNLCTVQVTTQDAAHGNVEIISQNNPASDSVHCYLVNDPQTQHARLIFSKKYSPAVVAPVNSAEQIWIVGDLAIHSETMKDAWYKNFSWEVKGERVDIEDNTIHFRIVTPTNSTEHFYLSYHSDVKDEPLEKLCHFTIAVDKNRQSILSVDTYLNNKLRCQIEENAEKNWIIALYKIES